MERYSIPIVNAPSFVDHDFNEVWRRVKRRVIVESSISAMIIIPIAWAIVTTMTPGWVLALAVLGAGQCVNGAIRHISDILASRKGS